MKKALVLGAGGFIGSHLVKRLKREGYWVRGVDRKICEYSESKADEFIIGDLRKPIVCHDVLSGGFDELYQLAAEMGGVGYIIDAECEVMHNSALININVIHAVMQAEIKRYFFSSSVCVYRNMKYDEAKIMEDDVYPAMPDNEYGWEKLYAERMIETYSRNFGMIVKIARFQNCYGPEGAWRGGREKAPAAISRKVAEAKDGDEIDVWGDGRAVRGYIYIDDIIDGIRLLMESDFNEPVNIGTSEGNSVDDLAMTIIRASGKELKIKHIEGPIGVESRNFSNARIRLLGWKPKFSLKDGIALTYPWILEQVKNKEIKQ